MVIIFLKTLEKKKAVDDVRSNNTERRLHKHHTMSRGTTLFSRGTVEADRWLDLGQSCQPGASLESLWDGMPEPGSWHWAKEPGSATAITSLIRDLSLGNGGTTAPDSPAAALCTATAASQAPAAPPSKRQCRSLSFSDEFSGFRSSWRPQGSRVWTTVEKRRCHSGGSVRGGPGFSSGHLPAMQRSSSFSLPSRSSVPSDGGAELPFFNQRLPLHPQFTASPKLQTFQSLSCPGFSATDSCHSGLLPPASYQPDLDFTGGSELILESRQEVAGDDGEEDSSFEELDSDSACSVDSRPGSPVGIAGRKHTLWKGGTQRDIFQLGGELDLDQIERN
ncbi:Protein FAM53B [Liparis tanakae]|uniref:Protein FAM53B n=1 Tax=Liparis tanakae TaxID=230148 RepID=A0A4Z2HEL1_9TELE|nr:Protein FAM53B [Liparis tanakae]